MSRILKPKPLTIALVVLSLFVIAVLGGGLGEALGIGFLAGPVPVISFAAENVFSIGGFYITNSLILFWVVCIILLSLTWLATRKIKQIPSGVQSFFEVIIDFLDGVAGGLSPKARKFVGVAFILFIVILFSSWSGLIPVVGSVGRVELVEEWLHHRVDDRLHEIEGDERYASLSHGEMEYLALVDALESNSNQSFVAFDGGGSFSYIPFGRGQRALVPITEVIEYDQADLDSIQATFLNGRDLNEEQKDAIAVIERDLHNSQVLGSFTNSDGVEHDFTGANAGLLVPYLRGPGTDVNITITFALFAFVAVQFFGVRALGVRRYGGKFFTFRRGPIWTFVGLLEVISELSRIVSFSFRLFGNLFAGEVLLFSMAFLLPLIGIIPFLGLEVFVGVIQAFIFATLVLIFSYMATISHDEH